MPVGPLEIIIVLVIVLIIFGPKRLPQLGSAVGETVRDFRRSVRDRDDDADAKELPESEADAEPVEGEVVSGNKH